MMFCCPIGKSMKIIPLFSVFSPHLTAGNFSLKIIKQKPKYASLCDVEENGV